MDPLGLFEQWFKAAHQAVIGGVPLTDPESFVLATASPEGRPSARVLLLKKYGLEGFTFFTNYESRKGRELEANPVATMTFFWPSLARQIRIEGSVNAISRQESEAYFHSRPRLSQIGAWASRQGSIIQAREHLDEQVTLFEKKFEGQEVPLPPYWGGYRLTPTAIEFWEGQVGRLHHRQVYLYQDRSWILLSP